MWNGDYWLYLKVRFRGLTKDLKSKMDQVVAGRAVPSTANIQIGSARKLNAAVLYFDIEGSSHLSDYVALYTLNVVLSTMMRIVHDHDGYIEKNTGDGIMAIFTARDDQSAARAALQSAMVMFSTLNELINPHLIGVAGCSLIAARIGIDFGTIYVSRVGVPRGSSDQDRSFLTAIGPAANIACRLQEQAGTNEIWVGRAIVALAPREWLVSFEQVFPEKPKWTWVLEGTSDPYPAYRFDRSLSVPEQKPATVGSSPLPNLPPITPELLLPASQLQSPPAYNALQEFFKKRR